MVYRSQSQENIIADWHDAKLQKEKRRENRYNGLTAFGITTLTMVSGGLAKLTNGKTFADNWIGNIGAGVWGMEVSTMLIVMPMVFAGVAEYAANKANITSVPKRNVITGGCIVAGFALAATLFQPAYKLTCNIVEKKIEQANKAPVPALKSPKTTYVLQ